MRCSQCGAEIEGKFCTECGAMAPEQYQTPVAPVIPQKKKSFNWVWLAVLPVAAAAIIVIGIIIGGKGSKSAWDDTIMGEILPEPPVSISEINYNSSDSMRVSINDISEKNYSQYIKECRNKGFTVDEKTTGSSFNAYNSEGYELEMFFYKNELSITLNGPLKMSAIKWPSSAAGKRIPAPKSTTGKIDYEYSDSLTVFVGETSIEDFNEYAEACYNQGFNVDYFKYDGYFSAKDSDGWSLSIEHVGNKTMRIDLFGPLDSVIDEITSPFNEEAKTESYNASGNYNTAEIRPELKTSFDEYEAFITEFVDFMNDYTGGSSKYTTSDYVEYMRKYADITEEIDQWNIDEMNDSEIEYVFEVTNRVQNILLALSDEEQAA